MLSRFCRAGSMDDLDRFKLRLAETIAWCGPRASVDDPRNSLRTPELQPPEFGDYQQPLAERIAIVETLAQRRAELLRSGSQYPEAEFADLAGGRILLYGLDETVWDGASEMASDGFLDVNDTPAWDTWFWLREDAETFDERGRLRTKARDDGSLITTIALICWVPPQLIELVEQGIWYNPVDCISWATGYRQWLDTPFMRQLDAAGLIG